MGGGGGGEGCLQTGWLRSVGPDGRRPTHLVSAPKCTVTRHTQIYAYMYCTDLPRVIAATIQSATLQANSTRFYRISKAFLGGILKEELLNVL